MGENSKIQWTDHTFNPWRGCTKVSAECDHCYAETLSGRNPKTLGVWGKYGTRVVASESMWQQPLKWNANAEREGVRNKVFCASLADVFESTSTMPTESVENVRAARLRLLKLIWQTRNLSWLLLTKRPLEIRPILLDTVADQWADPADFTDRIHAWVSGECAPPNVWIGTSVGVKKTKDRIDELRLTSAAVRFLSCEPLLEDLGELDLTGINWVIVGGESGGNKRPFNPDWARSIHDQCKEKGVAFFMKQWDKVREIPDDLMIREFPQPDTFKQGFSAI